MKFNRLKTPDVYNRKEKEKFFKSVFEMNKEKIIEGILRNTPADTINFPKTESDFYNRFIGELDQRGGLTLNALKRFEGSSVMVSYKERSAENLFKGLKNHNVWETSRTYNRHQKINYDYLTYLGDDVWEYNDPKRRTKIIIDITNSPTIINITRVSK